MEDTSLEYLPHAIYIWSIRYCLIYEKLTKFNFWVYITGFKLMLCKLYIPNSLLYKLVLQELLFCMCAGKRIWEWIAAIIFATISRITFHSMKLRTFDPITFFTWIVLLWKFFFLQLWNFFIHCLHS